MNILITGVGGPTPRSFAIALTKYGKRNSYTLIGTDVNRLAIGLYQKDLFRSTYTVPPASSSDYWAHIDNIIEKHSVEYAVILPELEVLAWSKRKQLGTLTCKALLPDTPLVELLLDKAKMTSVLKNIGVVPDSIEFKRIDDLGTVVSEMKSFPFWVRSTSGTSGLGSLKVDSESSLRNWITINPSVDKFLASTFLPGRNLACKLLYYDGALKRAACGERVNYIMSKVAPSGITGNTSFGRLLNEPKLVDIARKAMDYLFQQLRITPHGFFTVDFKENSIGEPLITEINVRHVAFTQCFAAAGANFAEDTLQLLSEDATFDHTLQIYQFEKDLIFLRDVDSLPILMRENQLLG
jgi:hypothetical protein